MQYDYLEALVKDLSLYKIKTEINMKNLRIWQTLSLFRSEEHTSELQSQR